MNVYTMSICHWKYKQFRTVRKFNHHVNSSLEICVKVFHLINNANISLDFVQLLSARVQYFQNVNMSLENV